jgi:hypothetical protein
MIKLYMYIYEVIIFITGQSLRMMVMAVKDMEVARVRVVQLAVSVVERAMAVHLLDSVVARVRVVVARAT